MLVGISGRGSRIALDGQTTGVRPMQRAIDIPMRCSLDPEGLMSMGPRAGTKAAALWARVPGPARAAALVPALGSMATIGPSASSRPLTRESMALSLVREAAVHRLLLNTVEAGPETSPTWGECSSGVLSVGD